MRGEAMNNYMRALHQRFFQEPEYTELEERIEVPGKRCGTAGSIAPAKTHGTDRHTILCEEISLASFTDGFQLAWGIAKELEADGLYSFDQEQTDRICHQ